VVVPTKGVTLLQIFPVPDSIKTVNSAETAVPSVVTAKILIECCGMTAKALEQKSKTKTKKIAVFFTLFPFKDIWLEEI